MRLRFLAPHVLAPHASAVALLLALATATAADLRLPTVFGDHMVLQRGRPIPVWGWAAPGSTITASLAGARTQATVDERGAWHLTLAPQPAGGPHQLVIEGDGRLVLTDVLVGEVWIGSGQSNMQWSVAASDDAEAEIGAAEWPRIRLFQVARDTAFVPQDDVDASWQVCSPATVSGFSAVAYYFGRRLHRELRVPVGLLHSSWGGTRIEPWTDLASLRELAPTLPNDAAQRLRDDLQAAAGRWDETAQRRFEASWEALKRAEADSVAPVQAAVAFDDSDWPTMAVPERWQLAGLEDFDGLVWYRHRVVIPDAWAGRDLALHLGPADEADITFFNGVRVGATGDVSRGVVEFWDDARLYTVPGHLVESGPAVLAVRVIDSARAGGLWGQPPEELYLTPVDSDTDERVSIAGTWRYQPGTQLAPRPPVAVQLPGALYHAMIHPLIPYAIGGAIWYQGEANVADGPLHRRKMETLIDGWRRLWGYEFPFLYVQLAPYRYGDPRALPLVWEAQADVLHTTRNTGMAVTTDVGDVDDIHPTDKQTVGRRLADWALANSYGLERPYSGPLYLGMEIEAGAVRLRFEHADGLRSADGAPLSWFEIAGTDSQFVQAGAVVDGTTVVVSSAAVRQPLAVRFGWHEEATPNFVNGAGLPASPFRTHRW